MIGAVSNTYCLLSLKVTSILMSHIHMIQKIHDVKPRNINTTKIEAKPPPKTVIFTLSMMPIGCRDYSSVVYLPCRYVLRQKCSYQSHSLTFNVKSVQRFRPGWVKAAASAALPASCSSGIWYSLSVNDILIYDVLYFSRNIKQNIIGIAKPSAGIR